LCTRRVIIPELARLFCRDKRPINYKIVYACTKCKKKVKKNTDLGKNITMRKKISVSLKKTLRFIKKLSILIFVVAGRGRARHGVARQGKARQGAAGGAGFGRARQAGQGEAGLGKARRGRAGEAGQGTAGLGMARRSVAGTL
jgi:hypothetical protein